MGWLSRKENPKVKEAKRRMKDVERKLKLTRHFQDLDVTVEFIGSTDLQKFEAKHAHGDIRQRDIYTPEEYTAIIENHWKKGSSLDRHLHAIEHTHLFLISGRIEVEIFGANCKTTLLPEAPYLYIPAGTPHKIAALIDSSFLCTFEPWQSK